MPSYEFISDTFTAVLQRSASIGGRFFISKKAGYEINSDIVGQLLTDATTQLTDQQKYPLCLMLPPISSGELNGGSQWQDYNVTLFFLTTTYYDEFNQIAEVNPNTQTSTKEVIKTWGEMEAAANDFAKSLDIVMRTDQTHTFFRVKRNQKRISIISMVGVDRASGVQLTLQVSLFTGCDLSDIDIAGIVVGLPGIPVAVETDPLYLADKPNIATKEEVNELIAESGAVAARFPFTNASTVTCNHNFGKTSVIVEVYNVEGCQIYSAIKKIDNNNIQISLQPATSGEVIIKS